MCIWFDLKRFRIDFLYIKIIPTHLSFLALYNSFQIERNKIVVTVFLLIKSQTNVLWVHNQKENGQYDRIPFNLKRIRNFMCQISYAIYRIFLILYNKNIASKIWQMKISHYKKWTLKKRFPWKTSNKFSHIRISHTKISRMLLIYHQKWITIEMFTRKITDIHKNTHGKT